MLSLFVTHDFYWACTAGFPTACKQFVACVREMAEVVLPGGPKVRLWCTDRISLEGITEDADGMFRLKKPSPTAAACTLLVRLETVCVTNLKCCERNGLLEFRYCYGGN